MTFVVSTVLLTEHSKYTTGSMSCTVLMRFQKSIKPNPAFHGTLHNSQVSTADEIAIMLELVSVSTAGPIFHSSPFLVTRASQKVFVIKAISLSVGVFYRGYCPPLCAKSPTRFYFKKNVHICNAQQATVLITEFSFNYRLQK